MKEPNHKVKRRREDFINDDKIHSLYVDDNSDMVIYDHFGWLGSGLKDCNDKEIFEGDIINVLEPGGDGWTDIVLFKGGAFKLKDYDDLLDYIAPQCEIVGHIAEGKTNVED